MAALLRSRGVEGIAIVEPSDKHYYQSQERYSMYALKVYGLPELYWNGMLRGRM